MTVVINISDREITLMLKLPHGVLSCATASKGLCFWATYSFIWIFFADDSKGHGLYVGV